MATLEFSEVYLDEEHLHRICEEYNKIGTEEFKITTSRWGVSRTKWREILKLKFLQGIVDKVPRIIHKVLDSVSFSNVKFKKKQNKYISFVGI